MRDLNVRLYRPDDAASCIELVIELQDSGRTIDPRLRPGREMADEYLKAMHARCRDASGVIFVAEHDGEVVGLAMVLARVPYISLDEPPGDYSLVAELVVRNEFRRQGIGQELLRVAEHYARSAGARELRIDVMSQNRAARDLYMREGFKPYAENLSKILSG